MRTILPWSIKATWLVPQPKRSFNRVIHLINAINWIVQTLFSHLCFCKRLLFRIKLSFNHFLSNLYIKFRFLINFHIRHFFLNIWTFQLFQIDNIFDLFHLTLHLSILGIIAFNLPVKVLQHLVVCKIGIVEVLDRFYFFQVGYLPFQVGVLNNWWLLSSEIDCLALFHGACFYVCAKCQSLDGLMLIIYVHKLLLLEVRRTYTHPAFCLRLSLVAHSLNIERLT